MREWSDVKGRLQSLDSAEKEEIDLAVRLVADIIERRNELGLTQRQLAEMSGVKQSAIARLEKFGVIPRIDTLEKLVKPLNLEIKLVSKNSDNEEAAAAVS